MGIILDQIAARLIRLLICEQKPLQIMLVELLNQFDLNMAIRR